MLHQILTSGNFWFIFIVIIIAAIMRQPAAKGWMGELMVRLQGKMFLDKMVYHEIHNVTIPADEGQGTTQIDHVYVSKFGIFVVETKNMGGWIFGNEHDAMWTQKLNPNHSQKFQNPLRQNYKHTKTLAGLLDLPDDKLISVVVFNGDDTKFKTPTPDCVCYSLGYVDFIKKTQNRDPQRGRGRDCSENHREQTAGTRIQNPSRPCCLCQETSKTERIIFRQIKATRDAAHDRYPTSGTSN